MAPTEVSPATSHHFLERVRLLERVRRRSEPFTPYLRLWWIELAVIWIGLLVAYRGFLHDGPRLEDPQYLAIAKNHPGLSFIELVRYDRQFGWSYRPTFLFYTTAMYRVFGGNWAAYHLMGILLHGITVVVLMRFVAKVTQNWILSYGVGAVACCYMNGWTAGKEEAFWWYSAHSAVLSTLLGLLSLHSWLLWRETPTSVRWAYYAASALAFALALGAKQDAYSLPLVFVAFDWIYCRGGLEPGARFRDQLRSAIAWPMLPFLAVTVAGVVCNFRNTAYTNVTKVVRADAVRTDTVGRLHAAVSFAGKLTNSPFLGSCSFGVLLAGFVAVYFFNRDRVVRFLFVAALASCFPAPFLAGDHALVFGRFLYYPALWFSAFTVVWLWDLVENGKYLWALLAASVLLSPYLAFTEIPSDVVVQAAIWAILVCFLGFLASNRYVESRVVWISLVVWVLIQAQFWLPEENNISAITGVIVVAWLCQDLLRGTCIVLLCLANPAIGITAIGVESYFQLRPTRFGLSTDVADERR